MVHYIDSSALVKAVVEEPGSGELVGWLRSQPELVSSDLMRTELRRAVGRYYPDLVGDAELVLERVRLFSLASDLYDAAGRISPSELRSLDAVHLAAALTLGDDLESIVTYDDRLADAARSHGIPVTAPR